MRDFKITQRIHTPNKNLSRYLSEIQKEKLLSAEEEAELAYRAKKGDQKAKDKIIKANLRFVVSVAKAYNSPSVPLEDLISEGNKGLIEAIEKFKPENGFKFISYAVWHIRKNMFYYISKHSRQIRIPGNVLQELNKYKKLEENFITSFGRNPTHEEIFSLMEKMDEKGTGFTESFKEHIKNLTETVPLESAGSEQKDDSEFGPINWVNSGEETDDLLLKSDKGKELDILTRRLTPTQRKIIEMRYGLGEYESEMTISQIGDYFEKSEEWVRVNIRKSQKIMKYTARNFGFFMNKIQF